MNFEDIIEPKRWQSIQNILSSIINISLRTVSNSGEIIVRPSNSPEVCADILGESQEAVEECWQWFPQLTDKLKKSDRNKYYESICPFGLLNFALPFYFVDELLGYMVIGPVNFENKVNNKQLKEKINNFDIDEKKFLNCYDKLPKLSHARIEHVIGLLRIVISFMPRLVGIDTKTGVKSFISDKKAVNVLLKTFLELSMKLCDAEFGSVMVFEKSKQELSIQDAKGLSKEIVDNTKLKPGEGLAGLTIEKRKALFVNEQLNDREARLRMHKPKIKSAFVIPIFHKNEILGVISVATAKHPNRFSDHLMELLNELVGLALEKISLK
ncbi:MAG: PocR ligand-binding domain-containing protein [Candidatus Omnitrophota bacterium]